MIQEFLADNPSLLNLLSNPLSLYSFLLASIFFVLSLPKNGKKRFSNLIYLVPLFTLIGLFPSEITLFLKDKLNIAVNLPELLKNQTVFLGVITILIISILGLYVYIKKFKKIKRRYI